MHLAHQRARGIDNVQLPLLGRLMHGGRNAVRAVHQVAARWHFVHVVDEHHALSAEAFDDVPIVHDFVKYIERRAEYRDRAFEGFDRHIDARAESARSDQ